MNEQDKAKKMAEVMLHWANGGDVEYIHQGLEYWISATSPNWNWESINYRIKDRYRELKEAAKDPTKQIRVYGGKWFDSDKDTPGLWLWGEPPEAYEIRDKPPATKKVKLLAYVDEWGESHTRFENVGTVIHGWTRTPSEDKEIEVEE